MQSFINKIGNVLQTNSSDYTLEFARLAKELMNNHIFVLNSIQYRITEIEFYLNNKGEQGHLDPFAHKHDNYQTGQLRLHTSGVDIAIGNENYYGGILLRGLKSEKEYFEGPWQVLETIIKSCSIDKLNGLGFRRKELGQLEVYASPRAGLSIGLIKDLELQKKYIFKTWRFFTHPEKIKKYTNIIAFFLIAEGYTNSEIQGFFKRPLDEATLENYRKYIEAGKTISNFDFQEKFSVEKKGNLYGMLLTLTQKHPNTLTQ